MIGVELKKRSGEYLAKLMQEHRVLALAAGPLVIRYLPPLVISKEQIDRAVEATAHVLAE